MTDRLTPLATPPGPDYLVVRLGPAHQDEARRLFALMADVFDEERQELSPAYLQRLLHREDFWVMAASLNGEIVGGLTAHTLPMTRNESAEIFIYDVAVAEHHQRRGVGRQLLAQLSKAAAAAGVRELFVPADNEDRHALDFYRSVGGAPSPVTIFTFIDHGD